METKFMSCQCAWGVAPNITMNRYLIAIRRLVADLGYLLDEWSLSEMNEFQSISASVCQLASEAVFALR
jgi:hypothetical protein